jgi:hypothetical protein
VLAERLDLFVDHDAALAVYSVVPPSLSLILALTVRTPLSLVGQAMLVVLVEA